MWNWFLVQAFGIWIVILPTKLEMVEKTIFCWLSRHFHFCVILSNIQFERYILPILWMIFPSLHRTSFWLIFEHNWGRLESNFEHTCTGPSKTLCYLFFVLDSKLVEIRVCILLITLKRNYLALDWKMGCRKVSRLFLRLALCLTFWPSTTIKIYHNLCTKSKLKAKYFHSFATYL